MIRKPPSPHARRWLSLDPLHEPAQRMLMHLYAQSGQQGRRSAPVPSLCRHPGDRIRRVPPQMKPLPCMKKSAEGQEGRGDRGGSTPAPLLPQPPSPPFHHNLAAQPTPFVGRADELTTLAGLLDDPNIRLVTILGPGGVGKTRLALEAAAGQRSHFERGAYIVSLAPLTNADDIVSAMAETLDFTFYDTGSPQEQLINYLREKSILLVLDNFEHLLDGVGLVAEILQTAPQVKIIATRTAPRALKLQEEQQYLLQGLDFSTERSSGTLHSDNLDQFAAIRLFVGQAQRLQSDFKPSEDDLLAIGQICQLVEGIAAGPHSGGDLD